MTGVRSGIPVAAGPLDSKQSDATLELKVALTGDRRTVESLILEVRAIAQRCGLEIPDIKIIPEVKVGPKTTAKKARARRKPTS